MHRSYSSLFAALLFTGLFLLIARNVQPDAALVIDSRLANMAATWRTPLLTDLFRLITRLADGHILVVVGVVAAALFAWRRHWVAAIAILAGAAGSWGLTEGLKTSFARTRPAWPDMPHLTEAIGYSFPSGHALNGLAIYGLLLLLVWPLLAKTARGAVLAATVLLVAAIGFSRIYLGVHFATDVMAGWLVGLAWLCCCRAGLESVGWDRVGVPHAGRQERLPRP